MDAIIGPDHGTLLWWQMIIRGVIVFLFCTVLIRVLCRRAFGMQSHLDVALAVLVGSVLSRAVYGDTPFIAMLATALAMACCYYVLVRWSQQSHLVGWLVKGVPTVLAQDGQINEAMMQSEGISRTDLDEAVRYAHLDDVSQIGTAILERSGRISIVPRKT